MRILYGIVGEGMGHATRSRVVIEYLLVRGHEIRVVVSGRAFQYLWTLFEDRERIVVTEIEGLALVARDNSIDVARTVRDNVARLPAALKRNVPVFRNLVRHFEPECVISDFDTFSYLLGRAAGVPVIGLDNIQMLDRCAHDHALTSGDSRPFKLARATAKLRLPRAYHYLIPTFAEPATRKPHTTVIPPVLRPEILWAVRQPGEHFLVYARYAGDDAFLSSLAKLPHQFRVYGSGGEGHHGSTWHRAFSETAFIEDLRTARGIIATAGFSLMCEAIHLRVPMLAVPIEGQFEQELNARYLAALGYGMWTPRLTADNVAEFVGRLDEFDAGLAARERTGNAVLYACVDELLERVAGGDPPTDRLKAGAGAPPQAGPEADEADEADAD